MTTSAGPRPAAEVLSRQLAAIGAWLTLRRAEQSAVPAGRLTRQQQFDLRRRQEAWEREAAALRKRCTEPAPSGDLPRVVLIHRSSWLRETVQSGLAVRGVQVVVSVDDGGEGCGAAIAEAPELVFLEAALPTMTGQVVAGRLRRCSPSTVVVAQVPHQQDCAPMLAAGAAAAWPRKMPPADLVTQMHELLTASGRHGDAPGPSHR